jgi:hypothetical protein
MQKRIKRVICLQTLTVFWLGGGNICHLLSVHGVNDIRQSEIPTAELPVPESSDSEVEMATKKLKRNKSPGTDEIPAELITAGGTTIGSEIHKLINFILE